MKSLLVCLFSSLLLISCNYFVASLTSLPSRGVSNESLGRENMSVVRLATKLSKVTVNFIVTFHLQLLLQVNI